MMDTEPVILTTLAHLERRMESWFDRTDERLRAVEQRTAVLTQCVEERRADIAEVRSQLREHVDATTSIRAKDTTDPKHKKPSYPPPGIRLREEWVTMGLKIILGLVTIASLYIAASAAMG